MVYRAIGLMSGSSLDGLDLAYVEFQEQAGKWSFGILQTGCYTYSEEWVSRLRGAINLSAKDYLLLHAEYGHYTGQLVNRFIEEHQLQYKVALVASHGHTSFHLPAQRMTAQLGDGAAIAAETRLPVVSDLRAIDVAFGGQGAPIVPIGEKLLMPEFGYFLNIGGIANISVNADPYLAFDVCPANRVLNMLANEEGRAYDKDGEMASLGTVKTALLDTLNQLDYYRQSWPKSLANDFGTDLVYPLLKNEGININDSIRTFTEHIAVQVAKAISALDQQTPGNNRQVLVTGGGAFNKFLISRITELLKIQGIEVVVPGSDLVNYKEAVIMAFIGVLRWRQEYNVLATVTGAVRNSIGGALWTGQEA